MEQYIHTQSDDLDFKTLDIAVGRVFDSIYSNPLLRNPTIVTGLVFGVATDLVVSHKLNRPVTGYIMIGSSGAAYLYTSPTSNPNPKQQIILRTNAATTASILFF